MPPILTASELSVHYGKREALRSLSLSLEPGTVGLLGPNGSGKSTFMKTLLGFIRPHRGHATLFGEPVSGKNAVLRERIGYFPERSVVLPGMSSIEAVALAGELGGLPRKAALERAHEVLWFVGLGEARYRPVEEFSTGMQQRNKLAMAIVHDPEFVLLDEPTSGLDPLGRRQMLELVSDLAARGISVLLSTHLLNDVERVCDHVLVLNDGRLVLDSPLDELKQPSGYVYELRVREPEPGGFRSALEGQCRSVSQDKDGLVHVTMESSSTQSLFAAALASQTEIRHLRRFEATLEERFAGAMTGSSAPHDVPDGTPL